MSSTFTDKRIVRILYEFTSSGILCTNHINCRDQLCVNLDTGELTQKKFCAYTILVITSVKTGAIIWTSDAFAGSTHDITMLKEFAQKLGAIYDGMMGRNDLKV